MTSPGRHASLVADLPSDVGGLINIVQGLLIHLDWLDAYPVDKGRFAAMPRETLTIARRLDQVLERSAVPLRVARPPSERSVSTCRDYSLMLCSLLRSHGVPARLRCGFASYFGQTWEIIGSASTGLARPRHGVSETRSSTARCGKGSRSGSTQPMRHALNF
jgi:hypothetical protein